jgi:multidrug efflux pump subunit AcrA (membrane-fusion protein)
VVSIAPKNLFHDKVRFVVAQAGITLAVVLITIQVGVYLAFLANTSVLIDHTEADIWVTAHGRVEGATSQETKLASRVVGRLKEVAVTDGDPVRKGQVVAVLETDDLKARVDEAQASLERAQALLQKLLNGARPEERSAARAEMEEAQAAAENARQNYERAQQLFKDGGIVSQAALDQAQRDWKMGQAKLESARERYKLIMAPPVCARSPSAWAPRTG